MRSLKQYQVLKDITLPSCDYPEDIRSHHSPHLGVSFDLEKSNTVRLIDMLPASIQTVQIVGKIDVLDVIYMHIGLPEQRADTVPNLARIRVPEIGLAPEVFQDWDEEWIETFREVGMTLEL